MRRKNPQLLFSQRSISKVMSRGANPGTDSQFPAKCAGNLVSVPGLRRTHRGKTRTYEQFEKLVDLGLGAQLVEGVGVLLAADADPNEIAVQGEGILVVIIVADVEDPVGERRRSGARHPA